MELNEYLDTPGVTAKALADWLGVKTPVVSRWRNKVSPIPAARCPAIEQWTHRKVTCEEMRSDIDWKYLRHNRRQPKQDTLTECQTEGLYMRLCSISKALEGSGRLDEQEHPDAYATILDAMIFVRTRKMC